MTIEERADAYCKEIFTHYEYMKPRTESLAKACYIDGATEQKAIDDAQINELEAIVELTASVMGIGTKWFNDVAKMDATMELRERIMKYYE